MNNISETLVWYEVQIESLTEVKKKKLAGDIKDLLKGKRDTIHIGNMKLEKETKWTGEDNVVRDDKASQMMEQVILKTIEHVLWKHATIEIS